MTLRGRVRNGVVVFQSDTAPPDGTLVQTLVDKEKASRAFTSVCGGCYPVTAQQRQALLGLIGMWRTENPPADEEAERIVKEAWLKKHGVRSLF